VNYTSLPANALVKACVQTGEPAAWKEFVRRFQRVIAATVLRTARRWADLSPQHVDDLVQETFLKLCADGAPLLRAFQPNHENAIFGYIKVVTANLVHDHFKGTYAQKRGGDVSVGSVTGHDVAQAACSSHGAEAINRQVLIREVDVCLLSLGKDLNASRDRRIFWLYYRVGLPARAIAALPSTGLSTKGVESTLLRLTRLVRERLVSRQQDVLVKAQEKGIGPAESF
jgi:RNA polymerase sigma-70 factor (ECF subfamily)